MEITLGLLFIVIESDLTRFIVEIAGDDATLIPDVVTLFGQNGMLNMIEQRKYRLFVVPQICVRNVFAVRETAKRKQITVELIGQVEQPIANAINSPTLVAVKATVAIEVERTRHHVPMHRICEQNRHFDVAQIADAINIRDETAHQCVVIVLGTPRECIRRRAFFANHSIHFILKWEMGKTTNVR